MRQRTARREVQVSAPQAVQAACAPIQQIGFHTGQGPVFAANRYGDGRDSPDQQAGQEHRDRRDYNTGHGGLQG